MSNRPKPSSLVLTLYGFTLGGFALWTLRDGYEGSAEQILVFILFYLVVRDA